MWTRFMDMHSGGGTKENFDYIYIEAPEDVARVVFYNRFGHSADHISCTCCGPDYSVMESETLAEATGFERNLDWIKPIPHKLLAEKDVEGELEARQALNRSGRYLEVGEKVPSGFKIQKSFSRLPKLTVEEYVKQPTVEIIFEADIKDSEKEGIVPEQGWVWA